MIRPCHVAFYLVQGCLFLEGTVPIFSADLGIDFFEKRIRPVFVEHCYECHSAESKKPRGNLYLDSSGGWKRGGDSGPTITAGHPDQSLLMRAVSYADEDLEMPPRQKLPPGVIEDVRKWIAMGAPAPESSESTASEKGIDLEKGREFWSFQPLEKIVIPSLKDTKWARNEIDRFILKELERQNLKPTADAAPETLLRRLFIDLSGLPPKPEEIKRFVENPDPVKIVNNLLASPRFGERWGRHWLDLARYADSTGGGASDLLPDAWKYRDYVIQSFSGDKSLDEFISEQIAGDLIPFSSPDERYEHLAATGFLVLGPKNYINDDEITFEMDSVDEQVDTVGRVFLGMTLGCARCHDHKFDPVPMKDYYALAGIFTSTQTYDPIPATTNFVWNQHGDPRTDPDNTILENYEAGYAHYRRLAKKYSRSLGDQAVSVQQRKELKKERDQARSELPPKPPVIMAVSESQIDQIGDTRLRIRGNAHRPAEKISRGFLRVTLGDEWPIPPHHSGRLELAQWITSPGNPLTARVYVNRVWRHLMGRGLVETPDNFGVTGALPTHPELLDWLANWFLENGQSTKELIRLIVSSRTYQLAAGQPGSELLSVDPANRWLGRRSPKSLDAETIRDCILAVSGSLLPGKGGEAFPAKLKSELDYDFGIDSRRSIYLPRFRNHLPDILEQFDVANPATVVGRRDLTILPTQALYLMNNPFMKKEAERAVQRLPKETTKDGIRQAWLTTLGREPRAEEVAIAEDFLGHPPNRDGIVDQAEILDRWTALQQNLFSCVDFRFLK